MSSAAFEEIRQEARRADALHRHARGLLVDAVHRAAAEGANQREIAALVGRSQPEVSRLLKQSRPGPLALRIATKRESLLEILAKHGVEEALVFGSVATRDEGPHSDIDLLIDVPNVMGLGAIARLEQELRVALEAQVDVVPLRSLPTYVKERVLAEAVPL